MVNFKNTLSMPKTAFKMRGNLAQKEPDMLKRWEELDLYQAIMTKNADKPSYVLHDGPPYANGNIHMGHALNKLLKDFIVRYKNMNGFRSPYVPGWDTHGLPIEQKLTNSGVDRKSMSVAEFRRLCEAYALEQIDQQREDFKRLGGIGDWDRPYITLDPKFEEQQIKVFGQMVEKGYIYRGLKPVYWSPSSESALAEAEIEYHDHVSPSVFVPFKVVDGKDVVDNGVNIVIWTTTPWTLPANVGIAVHPDYTYVQVAVNGQSYIVVEDLLASLAETFNWADYTLEKKFKGSELEYIQTAHPFVERQSMVFLADYVTTDAGTGAVHTATGHGEDDYLVGHLQYKLPVISPVDNQGRYTDEFELMKGEFVFDANEKIIDLLKEKDALLARSDISHSYPHDWRTKQPIIFRATPQWFASVDAFRDELLNVIDNDVKFYTEWGKTRLYNMIRDRGDWVISRQRAWGVPIPVFYGENGEPILDPVIIEHVASLVGEFGTNVWLEREAKDLLPEGYRHPASPNGIFVKETDIMDVWFDSGSSHQGCLAIRDDLTYPADLYLEGSDQYRGWFNSSLITSVAISGQAPYKELVSAGFVMDGKGQKMSKSIGNVISPNDEIKKRGADIIRLWTASVDYTQDVRISQEILDQVTETYRRLRNTFRFLLGNTSDFNPATDAIAYDELNEVDKYVLIRFNKLVAETLADYEKFDFDHFISEYSTFFSGFLSSFYLDYVKDILYIEAPEGQERRNVQTVLYTILSKSVRLLAPILAFTMEEVYSHMSYENEASVHLTEFPQVENYADEQSITTKFDKFMLVRDEMNKALEEARNNKVIGKSLEAKVFIANNEEDVITLLQQLNEDLKQLFIVSQVELIDGNIEGATDFTLSKIKVEAAQGHKCERCWNVVDEVNELNVCSRCQKVLTTISFDPTAEENQ